jgi:hypothetical protein
MKQSTCPEVYSAGWAFQMEAICRSRTTRIFMSAWPTPIASSELTARRRGIAGLACGGLTRPAVRRSASTGPAGAWRSACASRPACSTFSVLIVCVSFE